MSVKPILFNTDMVRKILAGRKTVTRRTIKPRYRDDEYGFRVVTCLEIGEHYIEKTNEEEGGFDQPRYIYSPYKPGDILYVRETWSEWTDGYVYKAWTEPFPQAGQYETTKWHPSIHMPKEAARIWLKVTDVRVERLQDIIVKDPQQTIHNICSEGIEFKAVMENFEVLINDFKTLWDSTLKKSDVDRYGWKANPWVWVIDFEQCDKPEREG